MFTFLEGAFSGSLVPAPNTELGVRDDGAFAEAVAADTVIGKVLATGTRAAGDTHAGGYAIVSINF